MSSKSKSPDPDESLILTTRNVVESYIFATGHQNLSIYSERLLMQLVKIAQCQVAGLNFRDGSALGQVSIGPLGDAVVEIETKDLLSGERNTNYNKAKTAVLELMEKSISHERPVLRGGRPVTDASGSPVYEFEAHNLLNDVWINRKPGVIQVNVNRATWEAILDYSKGFKRYDILVARQFTRTCSLRIFKLISNQRGPISYTLDELRAQWGLQDRYKSASDFVKNTIESAKEELDRTSPWTFEYRLLFSSSSKEGKRRSGRKSITGVTFFPVHRPRYESVTNVARDVSPSLMLGREVVNRLVKGFDFSMKEIAANLVLFNTARQHFDLEEFLIQIAPGANRAANPQGYVVNSVKHRLKEGFGVVIRKGVSVDVAPGHGPERRTGAEGGVQGTLFGEPDEQ